MVLTHCAWMVNSCLSGVFLKRTFQDDRRAFVEGPLTVGDGQDEVSSILRDELAGTETSTRSMTPSPPYIEMSWQAFSLQSTLSRAQSMRSFALARSSSTSQGGWPGI